MGKKFSSDKPSLEEIRRRKKPNRKQVAILIEPEISHQIKEKEQEIARLEIEIRKAKNQSLANPYPKQLEQAQKELAALQKEAEENSVIFTFQDIGRKRYDDLITANLPTKQQKEDYKEGGGEGVLAYNPETFVPALISACAIEPEISLEEAEEICQEWSEGDIESLFFTALAACKERATVPLSKKGTGTIQTSPSDSTTPPSEESPGASS